MESPTVGVGCENKRSGEGKEMERKVGRNMTTQIWSANTAEDISNNAQHIDSEW